MILRRILLSLALLAALSLGASGPRAQLTTTGVGGSGSGASAAVTVDQSGTEKFQSNSNSFSSTGLTITAALTKPALVCGIVRAHGSNDVGAGVAMTWNGVLLTQWVVNTRSDTFFTSQIFVLLNPASGNQTLAVTATNIATDNFVDCVSLFNVNQTSNATAFPNTGTGNNQQAVVTSVAGHIVVGSGNSNVASCAGTILGTVVYCDGTNGAIQNAAMDYLTGAAPNVTVGYTTTNSTTNMWAATDVAP